MSLTMLELRDAIERTLPLFGVAAACADELIELLLAGTPRKQIAAELGIAREEMEQLLNAIRKELIDEC